MPRLTAERIAAMHADWLAGEKTDVIALRHATSRGRLCNIAVAEGWPRRLKVQRVRWQGAALARLEAAWRTDPRPRRVVARAFGMTDSNLRRLARRHGWRDRRRPGRRPGLDVAARRVPIARTAAERVPWLVPWRDRPERLNARAAA